MLKHRVIPCLLLQDEGLVKTVQFKSPKYVGDPINAIRIFNEKEVDEILVLDITASKQGREPNYRLIEQFATECFCPLTYGGGIRNAEQAHTLFSAGIEKICIQSAWRENLTIVEELAGAFGSQSIVASLDIKKNLFRKYQLFDSSTGKTDKRDWLLTLKSLIDAGVGEILINCVDKDGTLSGPDLQLIEQSSQIATVPLIICGGISSLEDIKSAVEYGADAVAAGAFFVYHGAHRAVLITYPRYEDLEALLQLTTGS